MPGFTVGVAVMPVLLFMIFTRVFTHLWLSFPMELRAVHNVKPPHPSPGSNVNKVTAERRTTSRLGTKCIASIQDSVV